jgi:hypothetical protein
MAEAEAKRQFESVAHPEAADTPPGYGTRYSIYERWIDPSQPDGDFDYRLVADDFDGADAEAYVTEHGEWAS